MSKIFDALRRAESERRKTVTQMADVVQSAARPEQAPEVGAHLGELPEEFVRELGILRNSIESVFASGNKRSILFTGATSGEGTTTIATSFARFLALQHAGRILLCELNARRPAFTRIFSINGDSGVTDYFTRRVDLASLVRSLGREGIDVLHVGKKQPTVIQVNLSQVLPELLEEAFRVYDTVVLDAPPVASCPETPPMTTFVDGTVLVVQAGRTRREVVLRAMESISSFRGDILGIVLNRKKYYIPEFLYKRI